MNDKLKELEEWLSERPLWIQDATNRILRNGIITKNDMDELLIICKCEVGIETDGLIEPKKIECGLISNNEINVELVIESLSDLEGINALAPRKPMLFESNLNVIYGQNGSGKSGYARIFKHVCGAKNVGNLHRNAYVNGKIRQNCNIKYSLNGESRIINWSPEKGKIEDLHNIEIYDSECAHTYINEENEVTYEPAAMGLLSNLIEVSGKLNEKVDDEINNYLSTLPSIPKKFNETEAAEWYKNLSNETSLEEVNLICVWDEILEGELNLYKKRLNENNPIEKAKKLRKFNNNINSLNEKTLLLYKEFSDEQCQNILDSKEVARLKRKVADEDAKKVFSDSPISGVDHESWKLLWEQARSFSETIAYVDSKYPKVEDEALCVLCQQPLSEDAKHRLISFEAFVKGNLENEAQNAENHLKELIEKLPNTPNDETINILLDSAGIFDEEERLYITNVYLDFEKRKADIVTFSPTEEIHPLPERKNIMFLRERQKTLENNANEYEKDAKEGNRELLHANVNKLEIKKWLNEQKDNIENEIKRLKVINSLNKAKRLMRTQAISMKKSTLSEEFITEAYVERFKKELQMLGASYLNIELIKTRTQRGHVLHEIKLSNSVKDIKTAEVLSEGEQRIVSLASFLADVEGTQLNVPFIFDDPISSLDQEFEEATVSRLIRLCETRQLIVFTHRISLLTLLEEEAKSLDVKSNIICIRREHWGTGEPGDIPIFVKKPDSALNAIYNDRLPRAEKILKEIGREEYDLLAKGICSDFRIILERLIETNLLGDIVRRFRRTINTKGKIGELPKINQKDCQMFDELMTKYSKYEHSQSNEAPILLPEPEGLRTDIETLNVWVDSFKKRRG